MSLLQPTNMMHGEISCPAPVDWLRSILSDIADTIMILRRDSITCSLVIMIRQTGDLSMRIAMPVPGRDLLGPICLRIAIIVQFFWSIRMVTWPENRIWCIPAKVALVIVQNDGEGARSAELEEYLNGYLLPYDSPYLKANIEYLGNLYWDNNTEEYWLAMTKCSLLSLFLSSKIPAAGILGAAATFLDVFNHFFGEDTPSDAWHDFYKVSIDVYIETSDFVGISHREYIYVWANNSPTSAFWYQVPTANCTGGNS